MQMITTYLSKETQATKWNISFKSVYGIGKHLHIHYQHQCSYIYIILHIYMYI